MAHFWPFLLLLPNIGYRRLLKSLQCLKIGENYNNYNVHTYILQKGNYEKNEYFLSHYDGPIYYVIASSLEARRLYKIILVGNSFKMKFYFCTNDLYYDIQYHSSTSQICCCHAFSG